MDLRKFLKKRPRAEENFDDDEEEGSSSPALLPQSSCSITGPSESCPSPTLLPEACCSTTGPSESCSSPTLLTEAGCSHADTTPSGGCSSVSLATKALKKKGYKLKLSYRKQWEHKYPWVYCENPEKGMFCKLCQEFGRPSAQARGAWTSRGIFDWNHATENLKAHNESQCHKDAAVAARMAEQPSVVEVQQGAVAKQISELKANNKEILLKTLALGVFFGKEQNPTYNYLSRPPHSSGG